MDAKAAAQRWADTWSRAWPQRAAEAIAALYGDWGSWTEQGQELTYAGVTVLRFDDQGQVVEHRHYDNHVERREPPYPGW